MVSLSSHEQNLKLEGLHDPPIFKSCRDVGNAIHLHLLAPAGKNNDDVNIVAIIRLKVAYTFVLCIDVSNGGIFV